MNANYEKLWNEVKERIRKDIIFYKSDNVKRCIPAEEIKARLTECEAHIEYMNEALAEYSENVAKVKKEYNTHSIVMSELLRTYKGQLTRAEVKYLLKWSGDDIYVELEDYLIEVQALIE